MRLFLGGCLGLAALLWMFGGLFAEEGDKPRGPDGGALFDQLDKNKDGKISRDEVPDDKRRLFDHLLRKADKDKDGTLSRDEFIAGLKEDRPEAPRERSRPDGPGGEQPDPEKMFKRLDANGDGKITADEVPEERLQMFNRLLAKADKDGDGALSKEEFLEGIKAIRGLVGKLEGAPAGGGEHPVAAKLFKHLDKNGDGKITLDEVPEQRLQMFERLLRRAGKTGEQGVTEEEFTKALEGRRGNGAPGDAKRPNGEARDKERPDGEDRPPRRPDREEARREGPPRDDRPGERRGPPGPPPGRPGGLFAALDTDGDGELSEAEISAAPSVLRKLDKNGDGKLTRDEAMGGPPPGPPRERRDGEGGRDERRRDDAGREERRGEGPGRGPQRPGGEGAGGGREQMIKTMLKHRFDEMDANGDGVIDRDEFEKHARHMIENLGRNFGPEGLGPRRGGPPDGDGPRDRDRRPPRDGDGERGAGRRPDGPPNGEGRPDGPPRERRPPPDSDEN